jgi:hypothetical protein
MSRGINQCNSKIRWRGISNMKPTYVTESGKTDITNPVQNFLQVFSLQIVKINISSQGEGHELRCFFCSVVTFLKTRDYIFYKNWERKGRGKERRRRWTRRQMFPTANDWYSWQAVAAGLLPWFWVRVSIWTSKLYGCRESPFLLHWSVTILSKYFTYRWTR